MALNLISNFAANVATRNLAKTDAAVTASLSKLSSGQRVVSAKDDAASLAIGSRLRAEVAALKQASVNAGQASSLLQIADGALATTGDILIRMKALAVQSASGQLSSTERTILNAEFTALKDEITRISNDTEFNGTSLIKGADVNEVSETSNLSNFGIQSVAFDTAIHTADNNIYRVEFAQSTNTLTIEKIAGGGPTTQSIVLSTAQIAAIDALEAAETLEITVGTTGVTVTFDRNFDSSVDIRETNTENVVADNAQVSAFSAVLVFNDTFTIAGYDALLALATSVTGDGGGYNAETGILRIAITSTTTANNIDLGTAATGFTFGGDTTAVATGDVTTFTVGTQVIGTVTFGTITSTTTALKAGFLEINIGQGLVSNEFDLSSGSTSFTFQIGTGTVSDTDDVTFTIANASASALSISSNNISTDSAAISSITAIGTAIDTINSARSDVGAAQNRLGFASSNLAASIENAEAARSQLLDLDIASEITLFTSKQVLLQAGVAMLSQANQLPQNLLRLLQ